MSEVNCTDENTVTRHQSQRLIFRHTIQCDATSHLQYHPMGANKSSLVHGMMVLKITISAHPAVSAIFGYLAQAISDAS